MRVWVCVCAATGKNEKLKNEGTFMTWKKVIWEKNIFSTAMLQIIVIVKFFDRMVHFY